MHNSKNIIAVAIIGIIFGTSYFLNPMFLKVQNAQAGASQNVSGWAYSKGNGAALNDDKPGIGWISFNSFDCDVDRNGFTDSAAGCGGNNTTTIARDYGVNIDIPTGNFSGNAWGENAGWIKFDPTGPYPSLPNHGARLESNNTVTGWARACAGTVNGDCTGADRADGWDGWVKLSKDAGDAGVAYGVTLNPATGGFSGYAWGYTVVGWIDFAPTIMGGNVVHIPVVQTECTQSNPTFFWSSCPATGQCVGDPSPRLVDVYKIGACTDGTPVLSPIIDPVACASRSTTCTAAPGNPVCGDTACNYGETTASCAVDCHFVVPTFRQF